MRTDTIVAYTYQAETLCPRCICRALNIGEPVNRDGYAYYNVVEAGLNELAARTGVDRHDERTFDSGDFPKIVFARQLESIGWGKIVDDSTRCDRCDRSLI